MSRYQQYEKLDIEIGNRIRESRLSCDKMSQNTLGINIGHANGNQISKYEMGKPVPIKTLQKIASELNVDIRYLQTGKADVDDSIEMTPEQREYFIKLLSLPEEYQNKIYSAITYFEKAEKALQL